LTCQTGLLSRIFTQTKSRLVCIFTFLHHIIADGWSIDCSQRSYNYNSLVGSSLAALPVLGIQYKDYGAWLRAGNMSKKGFNFYAGTIQRQPSCTG
jgi:hypothetical protein